MARTFPRSLLHLSSLCRLAGSRGRGWRGHGGFFLLQLSLRFRVLGLGDVTENLNATLDLVAHDDPVVLVNGNAGGQTKLAGEGAAVTKPGEQVPLFVENLHVVLSGVRDPDVAIAIDRDALRPLEGSGGVAPFAEHGNELAVGIEHLDAIVQRVGDVNVPILVEGDVGRFGEGTGIVVRLFLGRATEGAQQLVAVGVEHEYLFKSRIDDIEEPILGINRDAAWPFQIVPTEGGFQLELRIENGNLVERGVGNEQAIVIVERDPDDGAETGLVAVAQKLNLIFLQVEDEDGRDKTVADINPALGVHRNPG